MLLVIPSVFISSETSTTKIYDPITKTVTIEDLENNTIAEIQLLTPLVNEIMGTGWQRVAEFEITLTTDKQVDNLQTVNFYEETIGGEYIGNDGYYFMYLDSQIRNELVYQPEECDEFNSTICKIKADIVVETWRTVEDMDGIPEGNTLIGLYYNMDGLEKGELIEWVPTLFDTEIEEWAAFYPSIREYYVTGDDTYQATQSIYHRGQTWSLGYTGINTSQRLTNITIKAFRESGDPGVCSITLQGVNPADGKPNGTILATASKADCGTITDSSPGLWYNFTFPVAQQYTLLPGENYTWMLSASGSGAANAINPRRDTTDGYPGGQGCFSNDNETSWTCGTVGDYMFEIWGIELVIPEAVFHMNGTVKFSNGTAVNLADVYAVWQHNNTVAKNTTTAADGSWGLNQMPNSTYIVTGYDPTNSSINGAVYAHVVHGT